MTTTAITVSASAVVEKLTAHHTAVIDQALAALRTAGFVPKTAGDTSVFVDTTSAGAPNSTLPVLSLTMPKSDHLTQLAVALYAVADLASGGDYEDGGNALDNCHPAFCNFYEDYLDVHDIVRVWVAMTTLRALDCGDAADWVSDMASVLRVPAPDSDDWDVVEVVA